MALVAYSRSFAEKQIKRNIGACQACKRESFDMRICARCGQVKYCNKACQGKDFAKHEELCVMWSNFEAARNRMSAEYKRIWLIENGKMGFSFFLASLPDLTRYKMIGQMLCVIVEIVYVEYMVGEVLPNIAVRDVTNQFAIVTFEPDSVDIEVIELLFIPGRFLLLVSVFLRVLSYTENYSEINIVHKDQFKVIPD